MSDISDEELLKAALQKDESEDEEEWFDIKYYQERFNICNGTDKVYLKHLFYHYEKWSIDPVSFTLFCDIIKVRKKHHGAIYINKDKCTINLDQNLGSYVKHQKTKEKEKRLRQISSIKSQAKCED